MENNIISFIGTVLIKMICGGFVVEANKLRVNCAYKYKRL